MRDWRFGIPGPHVTKYVSKFFVFTSRFCWYSVFCNADTHRTYWGLINIDHISFTYPTYKMLYITRFYKKSLISVQNAFVSLQWRLFSYRWSTSFVEILTFAYHNINFWRIWDFFFEKMFFNHDEEMVSKLQKSSHSRLFQKVDFWNFWNIGEKIILEL